VGKASFGRNTTHMRSQEDLLPKISHIQTESSAQSIRKMPRIVRKILEKKMNIDSTFIKEIENKEKNLHSKSPLSSNFI